ncbi:MAG: PilZ domain-containing protein [Candidatus Abyssobacteria bacterium SURF_5]|uniref:PilZ domain-containing protein n=1 Tax=Abyssobacteria bacterium (strain SURF_5) TaxID=2093360 RepID=A0A3A4N799_ABYX5|nr:MAG: PilZ domain-containing protein [Candidatus Abyssubacteria bacterium SURF_5]
MKKQPGDNGKKAKTGERRKFMRYSCKTSLKGILDFNPSGASRKTVKAQDIQFQKGETAYILNISERGLALELDHSLPPGLMVKIAIENPVAPPIETDGRVVWADKLTTKTQGYIIGMSFRHMREKHQRNLQRLITFLQNIPE